MTGGAGAAGRIERYLAEVERAGTVTGMDGVIRPLYPASIRYQQGRLVRDLIASEGAAATVETGLANGISALFACAGLLAAGRPGARHLAIDPYQSAHWHGAGLAAIARCGLGHLAEVIQEDSALVLPRLVAEGRQFDLAFVDGDHRFHGVFLDLAYLGRLVRGGGLVILDDYNMPSVAKAVRYFRKNLGWEMERLVHRLAVLRLPAVPVSPAWNEYEPF
jgi:predicted O-methyltransferase YrrM